MDILSHFIQGGLDGDGEEVNAEHCDDSQVVVIMMVMARMMLLMRRALLIVFSTSGSKVFKLTVEILVREARGQVQASPTISSTALMSLIVMLIAVVIIIIINQMTNVFNLFGPILKQACYNLDLSS